MDKVAILIPCYNEALTIEKVIQDCHKYYPEGVVYVYDNNSTDDTVEIAKRNGAIVRHEKMQGKGYVVKSMFREIEALCYVMVDGDDTYGLETLPQMIAPVLNDNCDMVIGDRLSGAYFNENHRPFHNFGNKLVKGQIRLFFNAKINDIMTGYRAFSYAFVKSMDIDSNGFEIETEFSIRAVTFGAKTEEITITYRDRPEGSFSKLNTYRDGFKVLMTIQKKFIKYRPLYFFSILSAIFTLLGIGLLIPCFIAIFQSNGFGPLGCLITGIASLLIAISCGVTGAIFQRKAIRRVEDYKKRYELAQAKSVR